ncbi:unnamed protein product [Lathyrus oleraceus]
MEFQNGDDVASNLLKAQSHIWNHIFNFMNSMSLKCVVDLGIPDIIHNYGKPSHSQNSFLHYQSILPKNLAFIA